MPSCTSSTAFSAAAFLNSSCSVKGVANRLDPGSHALFVTKDGVSRHQHGGDGPGDERGGPGVDSTVHLDLHLRRKNAQPADLVRAVRYELLAAETRLD